MNSRLAEKDEEIQQLHVAINDLEQYSRRSHLRIHGLRVPENAECKNAVCNFVKENLRRPDGNPICLSPEDIDAAHPLPARKNDSANQNQKKRPPSLIVRFFARDTRDKILRARKQLKSSGVSITEDLTNENLALLKRLQTSSEYDSCWAWMGKIYAKKKGSDSAIKVKLYDL